MHYAFSNFTLAACGMKMHCSYNDTFIHDHTKILQGCNKFKKIMKRYPSHPMQNKEFVTLVFACSWKSYLKVSVA